MSIAALIELDKTKKQWLDFISVKNHLDQNYDRLKKLTAELEIDPVFIINASENEVSLLTEYQTLVNIPKPQKEIIEVLKK